VIITGGSEAAITPLGMAGFCSAKALSTATTRPKKPRARSIRTATDSSWAKAPASSSSEELEHARKRGARIYAEFLGFGMSGDGTHIVEPDPTGNGPARAMLAALKDGRSNPGEITYITRTAPPRRSATKPRPPP